MRLQFDRSTETINRLHRSGADAGIPVRLFDRDGLVISFDVFVSVFWQVLLEGVRAPPNEYDITYELEPGELHIESVDDHLRIEERRPDTVRGSLATDLQVFVTELVAEAETFETFCRHERLDIEQSTMEQLRSEIGRTREWYRMQYGTDLPRRNG